MYYKHGIRLHGPRWGPHQTLSKNKYNKYINIKLINNCNIEVLVKYKKLKVVKCFSLLGKVIINFKKCSSLIVKTLIIYRIGEDQ